MSPDSNTSDETNPSEELIPPELQRLGPRGVRPKASFGRPKRGIAALQSWLAIFMVALWIMYRILDPVVFFRLPTVPATYLGSWTESRGKGGSANVVKFRYTVNGKPIIGTDSVGRAFYCRLHIGIPLRVRLLSFANNRYDRLDRTLDDYVEEMGPLWTMTAIVLLVGAVAWIRSAVNAPRERNLQLALVRDGLSAVATLDKIQTGSFRVGPPEKYFFEFAIADGGRMRVRAKGAALSGIGKRRRGDLIVILYDRQRPEICRAYEGMDFFADKSAAE
jgi:hypothetical protein